MRSTLLGLWGAGMDPGLCALQAEPHPQPWFLLLMMLSFVLSSGIINLGFVVILLPQALVLRLNSVSTQKAVCVGWGWLLDLSALTSISVGNQNPTEVNNGS